MFDNFTDYIWYLLWSPIKKVSKSINKWYLLFRVIGGMFDELKETLLKAREESMVATCSQSMLVVHAADRKLTRYNGESYENFRRRIALFPEVCVRGGTLKGLSLAIKSLGYLKYSIIGAKDFYNDEARWSEFYVIITFHVDERRPVSTDILKKVIRDTKETGALDNYLFSFLAAVNEIRQVSLNNITFKGSINYYISTIMLDGLWKLNGEYLLNSNRDWSDLSYQIKSEVTHVHDSNLIYHEEDNLYFLNGTWNMDGSKLLSSYQKTEVI